jgi:hypothetical protein
MEGTLTMTKRLFSIWSLGLSATVAILLTGIVASPAMANTASSGSVVATTSCAAPQLSQPFLSWSDTNWYTLAPGETPDNFDGNGWTLAAGASITPTQLADGHIGSVLDLPGGALAISPRVCVDADYPTARTMIETTRGATVAIGVYYADADPSTKFLRSGTIQGDGTGWSASDPFDVHPGTLPGWQMVRFIFKANGLTGHAQLYNFYIDPRMKA